MIRKDIRSLSAYHVPDASGMLKLDAMENPFPLPDELKQQWLDALSQVELNRYPDAEHKQLRQLIAEHEGISPDQVLLGNGSDEIIQMLLLGIDAGACVIPTPTFVMYNLVSHWLKRPVANVELDKDFSLNADNFLQVCAREKAAIAFLACPNNPTGTLWSEATIERIHKNFNGLLVIDEAYAPFASRTHTSMINEKTVVLRTFSKMGWAGLRLGYLLGEASFIAQLNKIRMPYNINALTQASAIFLLQHRQAFDEQAELICKQRQKMIKAITKFEGIEVFPSEANFLLIRVPDANAAHAALLEKKILIKNMHGQHPLLAQCLRITIGSPEENQTVLTALKEIYA